MHPFAAIRFETCLYKDTPVAFTCWPASPEPSESLFDGLQINLHIVIEMQRCTVVLLRHQLQVKR